jgi:hypothetical protein
VNQRSRVEERKTHNENMAAMNTNHAMNVKELHEIDLRDHVFNQLIRCNTDAVWMISDHFLQQHIHGGGGLHQNGHMRNGGLVYWRVQERMLIKILRNKKSNQVRVGNSALRWCCSRGVVRDSNQMREIPVSVISYFATCVSIESI